MSSTLDQTRGTTPATLESRAAGWWPSRWGADDEAGALNEITPDVVLAAVSLVRTGVAHQNGTVRFGSDPTTSALDVSCRMHQLDNLYVTDASFFPSSSAVNPTLTIIANALRVAERLGTATLDVPAPRKQVSPAVI